MGKNVHEVIAQLDDAKSLFVVCVGRLVRTHTHKTNACEDAPRPPGMTSRY